MYKMILSLVAALGFVGTAQASEVAYPTETEINYTLLSHVGGGEQVYYNCDSVEDTVESMLKKLGAENISVRCTGGLDQDWRFPTPANVSARFIAASSVKNNQAPRKASVQNVVLRDNGSCHLYKETLETLEVAMELEIVKAPGACRADSRIRSNFQVNVLAFE